MVWFGLTQYQGRVTPKYRRRRENPRQTRRNRERPKRIPVSAPTSQISTSLPRARSRGFYWRARFPRVRLHSCRRDHHVSCQQPVLNPAVQLERYGLFPRFSPCGHASYHHSHHLNSVIYEAWPQGENRDRKSTRLNSSHVRISYAVFCLKKKIA